MPDTNLPHEFLTLPPRDYPSDDDLVQNPIQPALETLFSEFARRHRSLSPSTQSSPRSVRSHVRTSRQQVVRPSTPLPTVDLRALDYVSDYDSHLMCPICHVPFINPVVLDCDHTFCASCFSEFRHGASSTERSQCPSCRTYILSSPRKASRLIYNMCNDIKVQCPNDECHDVMVRGYVEHHVTKDCPEQRLPCPDPECEKQSKRKNFVQGQCIHDTHIECECGAIIELGRGEWLKHKDESCPKTGVKCENCGERIPINDYLSREKDHVCSMSSGDSRCPGAEFGCMDEVSAESLEQHTSVCPLARLAPYLQSQSRALHTVQEQLAHSKVKSETLEAEIERMNHLLVNQVQPRLDYLGLASNSSDIIPHDHDEHDQDHDIEEIPRETIPSAAAIHHRDLLLPAHIRDLTPSPDLSTLPHHHYNHQRSQPHTHSQSPQYTYLLSLHESLRHTVTSLESEINTLHNNLSELDARTSMAIMNETLRIKEDLAHTNAALFSNRSQVQWLLNRERMGREQAILRGRAGLVPGQGQGQTNTTAAAGASSSTSTHTQETQQQQQRPRQTSNGPLPSSSGIQQQQQQQQQQRQNSIDGFPFANANASGSGSAMSSVATSPMFTGVGMVSQQTPNGTRRPSVRGGSQERVKL